MKCFAFVFILCGILFADEAPNVIPPSKKLRKHAEATLEQMGTSPILCKVGYKLPKEIKDLPSYELKLSDDYNGSADRFIIPISDKPEKFLEEGDIVIFFTNPNRTDWEDEGEERYFEKIMHSYNHAALIYKDDKGHLAHLDSPARTSSDKFTGLGPFHILRLRKYPPNFTPQDESHLTNEEKVAVEKWTHLRKARLYLVAVFTDLIRRTGYHYDPNINTEVADPAKLAKLRRELTGTMTGGSVCMPGFYCSELPATIYALAGFPLIKGADLQSVLKEVDDKVFPILQNQMPEKTKSDIYNLMLDGFFHTRKERKGYGLSESEINQFRSEFHGLLSATPADREKILANKGTSFSLITPETLFKSALDPSGYFGYVGTYVGDKCELIDPNFPSR